MLIQVNTDSNIEGNSEVTQQIKTVVGSGLEHFSEKITRVEVHLSDENSARKSGTKDMRCLLEARLSGLKPVTVSHQAATLEQAVEGAVDKLERFLDSTLGRLGERKTHDSSGHRIRVSEEDVTGF